MKIRLNPRICQALKRGRLTSLTSLFIFFLEALGSIEEELDMNKETASQRLVYIASGLVIGVTALWAFWFLPRLVAHPEAIADRVDRSSKVFFAFRLAGVICLLAYVILRRYAGSFIKGLLYFAVILIFLHDFFVIDEAPFYMEYYRGLQTLATLMLVCFGVDLIAGILGLIARHWRRRASSAS